MRNNFIENFNLFVNFFNHDRFRGWCVNNFVLQVPFQIIVKLINCLFTVDIFYNGIFLFGFFKSLLVVFIITVCFTIDCTKLRLHLTHSIIVAEIIHKSVLVVVIVLNIFLRTCSCSPLSSSPLHFCSSSLISTQFQKVPATNNPCLEGTWFD